MSQKQQHATESYPPFDTTMSCYEKQATHFNSS